MRKFVSSMGFLGYLPIMPGTYASAVTAGIGVLAVALCQSWLVLLPLALLTSAVAVVLARDAEKDFGAADPKQFVLDEAAGQFIAMFAMNPSRWLLTAVVAFFTFRVFDVLKPWPIRRLEKLPRGWGVVADDLLAGCCALVVTQVVCILT